MSIRRVVELYLDRAAAKRTAQDAQDALAKGTAPDAAEKNLSRVGRAFEGLRGLAIKLAGALGVVFGLRALRRFGEAAITAAMEAGAVWQRLAGQLGVAGVAFSDVADDVERLATSLERTTTAGDEDVAEILTTLVGITNDYSASMDEVQTVLDLAAAKQLDYATAAQIVGKAMVGNIGTLSRYGIVVEKGGDAMEVLRDRFRGMAENEAQTFQGRLTQLTNAWGNFQEAMGVALIDAGGGTSILETITGAVRGLTATVEENRGEIAFWGSLVIEVFIAVGKTVLGFAMLVKSTFTTVGAVINTAVTGWQLILARFANVGTAIINGVIEGLNFIPGVDIDFRMNSVDLLVYEEQAKAAASDLAAELRGVGDALVMVGDGWVDVGQKAFATQRTMAATTGVVGGDVAPIGGDVGLRTVNPRDLIMPPDLEDEIISSYATMYMRLRELSDEASPFEGLIEETALTAAFMSEGFAGVGRAIVAQLTEGRAEAEFAAGLAALAAGTWPPNPLAIAAAGRHFAAAAAFKAVGTIAASALGSKGFGGGAGGRPAVGALGTSGSATRSVMGAEVHIYLDQLSPADPRFQRAVLGATQNAVERFGENVKVNVHPRSNG